MLSRAFAAGNTAVNVPVLSYFVCVWHKLQSQLCRHDLVGVPGSQADPETFTHLCFLFLIAVWLIPPLRGHSPLSLGSSAYLAVAICEI